MYTIGTLINKDYRKAMHYTVCIWFILKEFHRSSRKSCLYKSINKQHIYGCSLRPHSKSPYMLATTLNYKGVLHIIATQTDVVYEIMMWFI